MSEVEAAIEELVSATLSLGMNRADARYPDPPGMRERADAAKSRLRALLTPTISEAEIEVVGAHCYEYAREEGAVPWERLPDSVKAGWLLDGRVCLEAVAAARQRATGSGVTGGD